MKGGAVAADGRIEPGDMLLQVPLPTLGGSVDREWGDIPTLCALLIQSPFLVRERPPDPPSSDSLTPLPNTTASPTPGPLS